MRWRCTPKSGSGGRPRRRCAPARSGSARSSRTAPTRCCCSTPRAASLHRRPRRSGISAGRRSRSGRPVDLRFPPSRRSRAAIGARIAEALSTPGGRSPPKSASGTPTARGGSMEGVAVNRLARSVGRRDRHQRARHHRAAPARGAAAPGAEDGGGRPARRRRRARLQQPADRHPRLQRAARSTSSPPDDPLRARRRARSSTAGERAAALTRQLLAFSRRQVLQPQVARPQRARRAACEQMLRRLIGEDVELVTRRSAPTLRPVTADPAQIEQVIDEPGGQRPRRDAARRPADDRDRERRARRGLRRGARRRARRAAT